MQRKKQTNVFPENMLIKQTDGKMMRKNVCLCTYSMCVFLLSEVKEDISVGLFITQMDLVKSKLKSYRNKFEEIICFLNKEMYDGMKQTGKDVTTVISTVSPWVSQLFLKCGATVVRGILVSNVRICPTCVTVESNEWRLIFKNDVPDGR